MVTAASTEEAMGQGVEGNLYSRTISSRGDSASPLLSAPVTNCSDITSHSTSSLPLSPSRKWRYSDAEDTDLRYVLIPMEFTLDSMENSLIYQSCLPVYLPIRIVHFSIFVHSFHYSPYYLLMIRLRRGGALGCKTTAVQVVQEIG